MTALLKNLWTLLRPVSRKEIDKINHELQAIHNRRFGTVYSKRVDIDLSPYMKKKVLTEPQKLVRCAKRVKKVREGLGVSQKVFGTYLDASQTSVSEWEHAEGRPNETQLKRLSQMTGHTVKYFYDKE